MRILVYCQHVQGIGHLVRTFEILKALVEHDITLYLGGGKTDIPVPEHVKIVQLPSLMMDSSYQNLSPLSSVPLEEVKVERRQILDRAPELVQPDIVLIELYPFGRNAFHFELKPLLEQVKKRYPACLIASSVRDILVERENQVKFEQRAIERLNRFFDLLLIHSDPNIVTLDRTFSRMPDITIPVKYTGYIHRPVTPAIVPQRVRKNRKLIIASAGGGMVGYTLLKAVLSGFNTMRQRNDIELRVFTGPYLPQEQYNKLLELSPENTTITRFNKNLPNELRQADLSVSLGGYNTTMDVVSSGCPALIYPNKQDHEQKTRALHLQKHAPITILDDEDLSPVNMAQHLARGLTLKRQQGSVQLNGAAATAAALLKAAGVKQKKH